MKHNKRINIVYIVTKLELGGAQKVCLSLFNGLKKSGDTSILISGTEGDLVEQIKNSPDIILLKNLKREVSFFNLLFLEIKNFIELTKELRKLKKKHANLIVHTHSTKAGLIGRWAAFFAGIKIRIHTIHGYAFHNHQNKIIWLLIYLTELISSFITTHFICVSSQDVKTGKKLLPGFRKKHSIIRAAVDWKKFYKATRITEFPENKIFIFGTVACFKKQKNLLDLFKAFKIVNLQKPNCILEVIGDGILRPELEKWIRENKLNNKIILHGWKKNVAEHMINWNAFVLSSLWEGLPCAVVEARLLKLPVLSYKTGGIHDVIIQGKNGFLYEQGDWDALAQGMLEVTNNKNLYENLNNYKENLNDFKDINMIQKHIKLYQNLIN